MGKNNIFELNNDFKCIQSTNVSSVSFLSQGSTLLNLKFMTVLFKMSKLIM